MAARSPHLNKAWGQVKLGSYVLGDGKTVTAMVPASPSEQKVDSKKKAGKSGGNTTTQGLEQRKGEIVVTFLRPAWDNSTLEADLSALDPAGPNKGGPFPFEYPGLGPGAPKSVLILSVGWPPKWDGEKGTITLKWETPTLNPAGSGGAGGGKGRAVPKGLLSAAEFASLEAQAADIRRQIALHEQILKGLNTGPARANEQNQIVSLQKSLAAVEKKLNEDVAKRVGQKPGEAVRQGTTVPSETRNADQNAPGAGGIGQGISNAFDQIHNPTQAYNPASSATAPTATP